MNISTAAHYLNTFYKIKRKEWTGNTYLFYNGFNIVRFIENGGKYVTFENRKMIYHNYSITDEWLPTIEDLLADDFEIYME